MTDKHTLVERLAEFASKDGLIQLPIIDQNGRDAGTTYVKPDDMAYVEAFVDKHGTVWTPPTAWAYSAACRSRADLATRITALEAREAELVEANQRLRDGYADAVSGYQYILQCHGRLNGVGFERVIDHFAQWVTIPEREDLVAGSHKIARATLAKHQEGEGNE